MILLIACTARECVSDQLLELASRLDGSPPCLLPGFDYLASEHRVESLVAKALEDLIELHLLRVVDDLEGSALLAAVPLRVEPHVKRLIIVAYV